MIRFSAFNRHLPKATCLLFLMSPFSAFAGPVVVNGEKFAVHTVTDQQQGGIPFVALMTPESWQVSGEVRWKYEDTSAPITAFVRIWNPGKPEAVTFFPQLYCYW